MLAVASLLSVHSTFCSARPVIAASSVTDCGLFSAIVRRSARFLADSSFAPGALRQNTGPEELGGLPDGAFVRIQVVEGHKGLLEPLDRAFEAAIVGFARAISCQCGKSANIRESDGIIRASSEIWIGVREQEIEQPSIRERELVQLARKSRQHPLPS